MKRSDRLTPVLELAETREKQATQKLGQSQHKLEAAQRSLESLHSFRTSYTERFRQSGDQGLSARQLTEYRAFLGKVNTAIAEQEKVVQQAEADVEKRRSEWEAARRHALGIQKVVENALLEETRVHEKQLQAEMDERASRRPFRDGGMLALYL